MAVGFARVPRSVLSAGWVLVDSEPVDATNGVQAWSPNSWRRAAGITAVGLGVALPMSFFGASHPMTALELIAVAIMLLICVWRLEIPLLLLVGTIPLEYAVRISSHPSLTITKLAGALLFASYTINVVARSRKVVFDRTHVVLLLLVGIALVSSLEARSLSNGLSTTSRYLSFVGLYIVLTQFLGDDRFKSRLVWTLSLASSIAAILAIRNLLSGRFSQATPLYGDPNDLAFVLATTIPLTFWLLKSTWLKQLAARAMIGIMTAGVILSFSRGAILGIGVGVLWLVLTGRLRLRIVLIGMGAALLAALILVGHNSSQVNAGLHSKEIIASYNVTTRLELWRGAAHLALNHPFLGVGPGNFTLYYYEATGRPPGTVNLGVVHDAYLDVAAELGLIGLVLFVYFLTESVGRLRAAVVVGFGPPGFAVAVLTSLIIALVAALTLSEQYYGPFWLLSALATLLWRERHLAPSAYSS